MRASFRRHRVTLHHTVTVAYVFLYLLAPLFHRHVDESLRQGHQGVHSHILNQLADHTSDGDCHHSLDRVDDHDLSAVEETVLCTVHPKSMPVAVDAVVFAVLPDLKPLLSRELIAPFQTDQRGEALARDYILFASNTSPPQA